MRHAHRTVRMSGAFQRDEGGFVTWPLVLLALSIPLALAANGADLRLFLMGVLYAVALLHLVPLRPRAHT